VAFLSYGIPVASDSRGNMACLMDVKVEPRFASSQGMCGAFRRQRLTQPETPGEQESGQHGSFMGGFHRNCTTDADTT
jgi:hypothetical protein